MSDSVKYLQLNKNKWDLKHFFLKKKKEFAKSGHLKISQCNSGHCNSGLITSILEITRT